MHSARNRMTTDREVFTLPTLSSCTFGQPLGCFSKTHVSHDFVQSIRGAIDKQESTHITNIHTVSQSALGHLFLRGGGGQKD